MKKTTTNRGFALYQSKDCGGKDISIQKSSIATEDRIWIGCDKVELKSFVEGIGWVDIPQPDTDIGYIANTRMEINKEMATELITILSRFIKTGEI